MAVREKEKRIYNLSQLAALPDIPSSHIHFNEWRSRKRSSRQLVDYLKKKSMHLRVLEIGCGNGWLSNKIADQVNSNVTGIDINNTELSDARVLWRQKKNLEFIYGDIRDDFFKSSHFDIIVFAASIQYFPSLPDILLVAISLLRPGGEIHILDTKFYEEEEVHAAIKRTEKYYSAIGYPGMAAYYFQHAWPQLDPFNYTVLYDPNSFTNRIFRRRNIFPWIKITR